MNKCKFFALTAVLLLITGVSSAFAKEEVVYQPDKVPEEVQLIFRLKISFHFHQDKDAQLGYKYRNYI